VKNSSAPRCAVKDALSSPEERAACQTAVKALDPQIVVERSRSSSASRSPTTCARTASALARAADEEHRRFINNNIEVPGEKVTADQIYAPGYLPEKRCAMRSRPRRGQACFVVLSALRRSALAGAAELKVISAGAVRGVLGGMIDDYARRTGHTFNVTAARPAGCGKSSHRRAGRSRHRFGTADGRAREDRQDRGGKPRRHRPGGLGV